MLSPYRINSNKRKQKNSNHKHDLERPRLTSFDLKTTRTTTKESSPEVKPFKSKNKLKGGANTGINGEDLDEILHKNNLQMKLAVQIISNGQTVRSSTVQDLKQLSSQSLATQARKGEKLVSMMPAIKRSFDLMGVAIVDLCKRKGKNEKRNR